MSARRSQVVALLSGVVVLGAGLLAAVPPLDFRTWERGAESLMLRLRGPRTPPASVVLVAIDDSTLQQGAWFLDQSRGEAGMPAWAQGISTLPWPRARYGDLLSRLFEAGPKAVGLNLVFEGPSSRGGADDRALAAAISAHRGRVALASEMLETRDSGFAGLTLIQPESLLAQAAGPLSQGLTNALPPTPGQPAFHPEVYGSTVLSASGAQPYPTLIATLLKQAGLSSRQPDAQRQLNFYGPEGSFLTLPAWQVLDPERWRNHPLRGRLREAVVLVGPVVNQGGSGTPTPFGPISGLELVATAVANSIAGDGLASWPSSRGARGFLAMVPGVLVLLVALRFTNSRWRLVAVGGVLVVQLLAAELVFLKANRWLPLLAPAGSLLLLGLLYGGDAYLREEGERRRLRRTFERYVAPSVVAEILSDPEAAEGILRGRALQVTVLFSDLKGFTQLTRARSSQGQIVQHVDQLNRYLGEMVEVITAHGGTVDKFIGDAVMAVFGSPVGRGPAEEARAALRCAAAMRRALEDLNARWRLEGLAELDSGIGLASGEAVVGQIGSPRRMEFTAIGDTVNLASRMEGLTRLAGEPILCDARTAELASPDLATRSIGEQAVKGMGALPVFTLAAEPAP
ncbi:adenylate/guanylate cyclase domain-containing protein [Synechococcus sp. CS-1328]|uniref:adenylate/guanylate cyclase domain-containing protein n=1 Tax=Synechococcus sp. CS-1328 TaxID=2847976 RepID=UPI00223A6D27|nr:adenylate/guanylate cyclase domain-containing protein [Synechococcus sp. CS-1328]